MQPDVDISLAEFLVLPDHEQRELVFSVLFELAAQVEGLQKNVLDIAVLLSRIANK